MPKLLKVDSIAEISLVDTGANDEAHVLIWKRAEAPPKREERAMKKDGKLAPLLRAVGVSAGWADEDVEAAVGELTEGKEAGDMSDGFDVSTLSEDAQKAFTDLTKRATDAEEAVKEAAAKAEAAEAKAAELAKKLEPEPKPEDVLKGLDAPVREFIGKLQAEAAEAKNQAEVAIAKADAETKARRLAEFRKEADEKLDGLSGEPEDKVGWLEAIDALPDEQRTALRTALHAASAVGKSAELFKEAGVEGGDTSGSEAYGKIMAKANELFKKDDSSFKSVEQAFDHVIMHDRELAAAYEAERKAQRR